MELLKKPYEISLWEDVLTFVYEDGSETEEKIENGHGAVITQYYKERKICIIGSDTMDSPIRATQPKLVSKINGENTLTFNLHSHYYDIEQEDFLVNPFVKLLVNERKVKLRYGAIASEKVEWYDLIIKNIQESSDSKTYTYTAKNLFVNELSKSGFNLEFNQELENNMGNIDYLAEEILKESDWKLKKTGEILKQTLEEPLYHAQINKSIVLKDMEGKESDIVLDPGTFIYIFYNSIINKNPYVQFLYAEEYKVDDDYIITNSPNWYLDGVQYNQDDYPDFIDNLVISDKYRGRRLVRKIKTKYDATIDKYVGVYEDESGKEIYGYTETEYISSATVRSYITNANSYESETGWEVGKGSSEEFPSFELVSVPDVRDVSSSDILNGSQNFTSCIRLNFTDSEQSLYNSGIIDHRHYIDGFVEGEKYVFRIKYGSNSGDERGKHGAYSLINSDISLTLKVAYYNLNDGKYIFEEEPLFIWNTSSGFADNGYITSQAIECRKTLPYAQMIEMTNRLGFFIQSNSAGEIYIEDVQFFPYIDDGTGKGLLPNEIKNSEICTTYLYYEPDENYKNLEEVRYVYRGENPPKTFQEIYNETSYEKVRSITASESNRFNLIQELCEIFECWPKFEIEHEQETGKILLDENYRQKKWLSFHEYIGKDNYAGFKYGINLKSIKRTIDSENIVSKLVVKNNSNEFATDGFCSIARATESPNGENFILDFSYYIQQNMLGMAEITNDLYLDTESQKWLGYYKKLKRINEKRDRYIKEQSGLLTDLSEYEASLQTYNLSVSEADKLYRDKLVLVKSLTGLTFETLMEDSDNEWWNNDQVIATVSSIGRLKSVITNHQILADKAAENLDKAQKRYDELDRILTSREESQDEERLLIEKENLHRAFYKKYSRFLQEGSWISEDYVDDNLYYLDAESTLNTSSKPKITYDISVLELSQLDEYENYIFSLGDKTTIEDTEFFGWSWHEGVQSPYREEIVVTELVAMLDQPEQNQIKVQNYKTQFEDLFQRMAATTQSVEYSTGKYQKVSGIVEQDGTISISTLQNSISNNALTLQNSKDQSVIWDESGITTTSANNPAEIVRIVSGGVFLSTDGGMTWNTGITGRGINASYITTGQINVEEISILNGAFPSFRWDNTGISAYEFSINQQTGLPQNFNYGKFVRLDQYGIYGINGYSNFNSQIKDPDTGKSGEDKIWDKANFALTWKGFQIRSKRNGLDGYIRITEEDDIQLINKVILNGKSVEIDQVKIGLLDKIGDEAIYGIRLKDHLNQVVLEQSSQGKVWIRDELKIGTSNTSTVSLGYLRKYRNDESAVRDDEGKIIGGVSQVIRAGDVGSKQEFVVYEDGRLEASGGYFKGEIHAESGTIGGLSINTILNPDFDVIIESNNGTVFKNNQSKILTATLYKGNDEFIPRNGHLTYQWYRNSKLIEGAISRQIEVFIEDLDSSSGQVAYQCAITVVEDA